MTKRPSVENGGDSGNVETVGVVVAGWSDTGSDGVGGVEGHESEPDGEGGVEAVAGEGTSEEAVELRLGQHDFSFATGAGLGVEAGVEGEAEHEDVGVFTRDGLASRRETAAGGEGGEGGGIVAAMVDADLDVASDDAV